MTSQERSDDPGAGMQAGENRVVRLAFALGLAAALLAAVALWASEGASVFVQNAFSTLAACL